MCGRPGGWGPTASTARGGRGWRRRARTARARRPRPARAGGSRRRARSRAPASSHLRLERLERRVGVLDRALGGGVARRRLRRLVLRGPRSADRRARPRAPTARPRPARRRPRGAACSRTRFFDGPAWRSAPLGAALARVALGAPAGRRVAGGGRLGRLAAPAPCAPRARARTPASRRRRSAACSPRRDRARADRVEQRAVVGDEQQRAGERLQRVLERLARLEVEVVGRLVEDQDVGVATATRIASDSRRRSPPLSPSSGFSASSPLNRKRPSSERAWLGVSPVRLTAPPRATVRAPPPSSSSACWDEVADLHVVAGAQLAAVERALARRAPRSASSCRCRWGRRARRARRARATARRRRAARGRGPRRARPRARRSPARSARACGTGTRAPRPSRGSRSMRSILLSFLRRSCAWRALVAL